MTSVRQLMQYTLWKSNYRKTRAKSKNKIDDANKRANELERQP